MSFRGCKEPVTISLPPGLITWSLYLAVCAIATVVVTRLPDVWQLFVAPVVATLALRRFWQLQSSQMRSATFLPSGAIVLRDASGRDHNAVLLETFVQLPRRIAVRFRCDSKIYLANVWRIEQPQAFPALLQALRMRPLSDINQRDRTG